MDYYEFEMSIVRNTDVVDELVHEKGVEEELFEIIEEEMFDSYHRGWKKMYKL
jgi:hypothetical protein